MSVQLSLQWLTGIPAPYRNHRYEKMREIFPRFGVDFEVLYLAWTEHDRYWRFEPQDLRYRYRVFRGIHPAVGDLKLYLNPGLFWYLRRHPADILVVGGLSSPSLWLAPFFCPRRTMMLMGSESNPESARRTNGLARIIKRVLVRRCDGFITPGGRSRDYLRDIDPTVTDKPFIVLPNIIDKAVYSGEVARARESRHAMREELGLSDSQQLWICSARLEPFKGLVEFLRLLEGIEGVRMLIAGEGSLRPELEAMIAARSLPVRLLGQQNESDMVRLYAMADLFVLPSLRDPSPLSPIEATAAGLPLLLSVRAGNVADVLSAGSNGWEYDPNDPKGNRETIQRIASISRDRLVENGQRSRELYRLHFDSDRCIERLAESLVSIHRTFLASAGK